jgi:hypothetical protein
VRRHARWVYEAFRTLIALIIFCHVADGLSALENEIAHEKWCNDLAAQLLCIFVLDRFSDFITDQVST